MLNHIELAKECGAQIEDYHNPAGEWLGCDYAMTPKQLTAFANAIIEECKVAVNDVLGDKTLASKAARRALDALKVEG